MSHDKMKEKNLKISLSELREKGIELPLLPRRYKLGEVIDAIIGIKRNRKWR